MSGGTVGGPAAKDTGVTSDSNITATVRVDATDAANPTQVTPSRGSLGKTGESSVILAPSVERDSNQVLLADNRPAKSKPPGASINPDLKKILDANAAWLATDRASGGMRAAAAPPPAPPRTVDHPKYAKVDLAVVAKSIPNSKYYPNEDYGDGNHADVIRAAPSGMVIIRKTVDDKGHKVIESFLEPDELAYALRRLPPPQFVLVNEVLNGQVRQLRPADISAREQAEKEQAAEAQRETQRLGQVYAAAQNLPAPTGAFYLDQSIAIGVGQHEVATTDAKSPKPILGSYGAASCWIIAIYNPKTHQASLAHFDSFTPDRELSRMVASMNGDPTQPLQIHIAGRGEFSEEQGGRLIDLVNKQQPKAKLVTADIGSQSGGSLAIDSRTGQVTTNVSYEQLDEGPDADQRIKLLQFQSQSSSLSVVRDARVQPKAK